MLARTTGSVSAKHHAVSSVLSDMSDFCKRVLQIIRWRRGTAGKLNPIRYFITHDWSLDGKDWQSLKDTMSLTILFGLPAEPWNNDIARDVEQLVGQESSEPFAHEIWHEAYEQLNQSARSAVVLGVAAAEIGFKHLVRQLQPQTQWLVENMPSPPLTQMLIDYLPQLPVRARLQGTEPFIPSKTLDEIKAAVHLRNQLVHGRKTKVTRDDADAVLRAARDLLYILDMYSGVRWTHSHLQHETLISLHNMQVSGSSKTARAKKKTKITAR